MEFYWFYLAFVGQDGGARVKKVGAWGPNETLALNAVKAVLDEMVGGVEWIGLWNQNLHMDDAHCLARPMNWRET